jgi:hypothetical protein
VSIFSLAKTIEVEQDLLLYAPRTIAVKYCKSDRLAADIGLAIDFKVNHLEDFRFERIVWTRSCPGPKNFVDQRSSETHA